MNNREYLKNIWPLIKEKLLEKISIGEVEIKGHALEQGIKRAISKETAFQIVLDNPIEEMYKERKYPFGENPFSNPDPVFTISGKLPDGHTVAVPFAVKVDRSERKTTMLFYPITLIHTDRGRHTIK